MNIKRTLAFLSSLLFPALVFADITLTPSASDVSYQYLSTLFGVVSGVLHGTGSQIFGQMFGVFNSALLALGGMIIGYTFVVGTLNTAGQGEVMGRDWSSIWIPIRSAAGIGLLLPKSTGYCAIQVFIMWVTVQGIGAADRIWETTLDYLKQGGVIIQQNASALGGGVSSTAPGARVNGMINVGKLFLDAVCLESYQANLENTYRANSGYPPPPDLFTLIGTQIAYQQSLISDITGASGTSTINIGLPWVGSKTAHYSALSRQVNTDAITTYGIANQCGAIGVAIPPRGNSGNSALDTVAPLAQARLLAVQQMVQDMQVPAMTVQTAYLQTLSGGSKAVFTNLGFGGCPAATVPCVLGTCTTSNYGSNVGVCQNANQQYGNGILSSSLFQDTLADYLGIVYAASQTEGWAAGGGGTGGAGPSISSGIYTAAKNDGWLMAGRYYIDLANANANAGGFARAFGTLFPIVVTQPNFSSSALGWTGVLNDTSSTGVSAQKSINSYINGAMNFIANTGNIGGYNPNALSISLGIIVGLIAAISGPLVIILLPLLESIVDIFVGMADLLNSQQANFNPIAALAVMGGGMMSVSIMFFIVGGVTAFALGFTLGAIPCFGFSGAAVALIAWIAPVMAGIIGLMFTSGAIMAYYIPMIPFILFTFGGIGWLIGVIEAMVAAPLVALGIAHPEGGTQTLGRGEHALLLVLNVFLKPSLMLFGYIFGIAMSYIGIWILNRGFMGAFYATVTSVLSAGGVTSIIGVMFAYIGMPLASIIFYTIVAMTIVHKAFSLIHVVPDRVLRWIGGSIEGHMEGQMEQETRAGMQKAYQAQGEMVQKGVSDAAQQVGQAKKEGDKQQAAKGLGGASGAGSGTGTGTSNAIVAPANAPPAGTGTTGAGGGGGGAPGAGTAAGAGGGAGAAGAGGNQQQP